MTKHGSLLLALFTVTGCMVEVDDVGSTEEAITCSGGCCGSEFNCSVPDPARREGCSGARIRNGSSGCTWPIRDGADRSMFDGAGNRMGEVRSDAVMLNQGIRKHFGGRWLVYAFAPTIRTTDGRLIRSSGWMEQASLTDTSRLHGYTLTPRNPGEGNYPDERRITAEGRAPYERLFIHSPGGATYNATDYLVRPNGLVNLTYNVAGFNLGGFSTDSFAPGAIFHRSRGVRQIEVPLYGPAGHRSRYTLRFIYGYIHDGEQRRYGWIAQEAMEIIEDVPEGDPTCSARCCDNSLASADATDRASCTSAGRAACGDHDGLERARFEGAVTYSRARTCWAKCNGRDRYHPAGAIHTTCTDAARDFCRVGTRGGLEDAMWDGCRPL